MAFTTKEIIKKHVLEHHIGSSLMVNEGIRLTGVDSCHLQNKPILAQSEAVKAKEQNEPIREDIDFSQGDTITLVNKQLVPDSVVVANNSSLGRIYVENIDYHIEYGAGTIRRLASGGIAPGASATVWYAPYRIYQRGVDYDIDYQDGTLRRRSSGAIEAGQWVVVDYTAEFGSIDDGAIENAISEADEQVMAFIDESYRNCTERALVAAETYLAIAIICRIKAMEMMSKATTADSSDARSWIAIAEMYRKESFNLMGRFAASVGAFKSPERA